MKKAELRKLYLTKRKELSAFEALSKSESIAAKFFEIIPLRNFSKLHTFVRIPKFNEVDTSLIYRKLWRDWPGITTVAPRTKPFSNDIDSIAFDEEAELAASSLGISEPIGGDLVDPSEIDIVLVPLLCIDERGYRVGYGKGMYDRFLARCRPDCLKLSIDYFKPVDEIYDLQPTDIRLNICITPDEVYRFD